MYCFIRCDLNFNTELRVSLLLDDGSRERSVSAVTGSNAMLVSHLIASFRYAPGNSPVPYFFPGERLISELPP